MQPTKQSAKQSATHSTLQVYSFLAAHYSLTFAKVLFWAGASLSMLFSGASTRPESRYVLCRGLLSVLFLGAGWGSGRVWLPGKGKGSFTSTVALAAAPTLARARR